MKKQLIAHTRIPYGNYWFYIQPETGAEIKGTTWTIFLNNIRAYRKANGLPIGLGFEDEIEAYVCEHQSSECEQRIDGKPRKRAFTLDDIVAGSRVMLSHWFNNRKVVDRKEAERRADICVGCPMNTKFAKPCSGVCAALAEVVNAVTNAQGTDRDYKLHQCEICNCYLSAAIWVSLDLQVNVLSDDQKAAFEAVQPCWKKASLIK